MSTAHRTTETVQTSKQASKQDKDATVERGACSATLNALFEQVANGQRLALALSEMNLGSNGWMDGRRMGWCGGGVVAWRGVAWLQLPR